MHEIFVWRDGEIRRYHIILLQAIHQESDVIPENVDAIRALMGTESDWLARSQKLTNQSLNTTIFYEQFSTYNGCFQKPNRFPSICRSRGSPNRDYFASRDFISPLVTGMSWLVNRALNLRVNSTQSTDSPTLKVINPIQ